MTLFVVRAFLQLRELFASNKEFAHRPDQLEARIEQELTTHDEAIAAMLSAIGELMHPLVPEHPSIGFTANLDDTDQSFIVQGACKLAVDGTLQFAAPVAFNSSSSKRPIPAKSKRLM
jgi:hypothetical protein